MSSASGPASVPPKSLRFGRLYTGSGPAGEESGTASGWAAEWVLKRNCSLRPGQLLVFYLSLCLVSLLIAGYFWRQGARPVMVFAGIELLVVGLAMLAYARHAGDRERVELAAGRLTVEWQHGARSGRMEFAAESVRIDDGGPGRALIGLSALGREVKVGRHVRPELRRQLAEELKATLRWGTGWSGANLG
ncbi:DUF2244 domain-containing protein [Piscinibacter sp. Jin2]|uniref:DUF2244 domain-containing protein n=1 Tax=Aquariibacter lacus TaxID=2801332 RepID=A0A9X0XDT5_9BURK|nr:DUF2244 domain-containing protein [Piscinibacter lacus]